MSFTLGGKTAEQLKIMLLEDTQIPVLPETRDMTQVIPGRNGVYDFGADLGPRYIDLDCGFIDEVLDSDDKLQVAVMDLAEHLVDAWGKPRELELVFDRLPDKTFFVRYAGNLPIERTLYHAKGFFTLPLTAFDPYAYGDEVDDGRTITDGLASEVYEVDTAVNVPVTLIIENEGTNILHGFSFKTFDEIFDVSF